MFLSAIKLEKLKCWHAGRCMPYFDLSLKYWHIFSKQWTSNGSPCHSSLSKEIWKCSIARLYLILAKLRKEMFHCGVVSTSDTGFCMAQYGPNSHIAKSGPDLIVLPLPPKFWNDKHSLTCLTQENISHLFFISWGMSTYLSVCKDAIVHIQKAGDHMWESVLFLRHEGSENPPHVSMLRTISLVLKRNFKMLGPEDMCYFSSTFISFIFIKYPPCLTFTEH